LEADLSNLLWKQAKYEDALEYGLKSEEVFKQRGLKDLDYGFTLYVIGNVYLALKQYDHALNYFQRSNEISEQYGFYNNLSDTYISLNELFTEKRDFEKARQASFQAIKYAELIQNNFLLIHVKIQ